MSNRRKSDPVRYLEYYKNVPPQLYPLPPISKIASPPLLAQRQQEVERTIAVLSVPQIYGDK